MGETGKITFRQDVDNIDGTTMTYATRDWPEKTRIVASLLKAGHAFLSENEHGDIIIAVSNGTAVYRRTEHQTSDEFVEVELSSASWSPPPPSPVFT